MIYGLSVTHSFFFSFFASLPIFSRSYLPGGGRAPPRRGAFFLTLSSSFPTIFIFSGVYFCSRQTIVRS